MSVWLQHGRYRKEREIVEALLLEGHDAVEIAAAALKVARADEKQRPIAPVSEVAEIKPDRFVRSERPRRASERSSSDRSAVSHEAGAVVRLSA